MRWQHYLCSNYSNWFESMSSLSSWTKLPTADDYCYCCCHCWCWFLCLLNSFHFFYYYYYYLCLLLMMMLMMIDYHYCCCCFCCLILSSSSSSSFCRAMRNIKRNKRERERDNKTKWMTLVYLTSDDVDIEDLKKLHARH